MDMKQWSLKIKREPLGNAVREYRIYRHIETGIEISGYPDDFGRPYTVTRPTRNSGFEFLIGEPAKRRGRRGPRAGGVRTFGTPETAALAAFRAWPNIKQRSR